MFRDLFRKKDRPKAAARVSLSALVDADTGVLFLLNPLASVCVSLQECISDSIHVPVVTWPHYPRGLSIGNLPPEERVKWRWNAHARKFEKSEPANQTFVEKAHIATEKGVAFARILYRLNIVRKAVGTGIDLQETVYLVKRMQASAFKEHGYNEKMLMDIPYVVQYADFQQISLKQAADEILFKAKLDDDFLAKTELLRLTYMDRIRRETDLAKIPAIMDQFVLDCFVPQVT